MESRTSDIIKRNFHNVSPYQDVLNAEGKIEVLQSFENKVYFIWAVPVMLTMTEIIFMKHNLIQKANRISLFKWISYILAISASNFSSAETLRRVDYYNRLYPKPPQIQREQIIDAQILKMKAQI